MTDAEYAIEGLEHQLRPLRKFRNEARRALKIVEGTRDKKVTFVKKGKKK